MRTGLDAAIVAALAAALLQLSASPATAEKADKAKPTQLEANRMSADDARRISIFEGNVVLSKGTITVRAERIVVRIDAREGLVEQDEDRLGAEGARNLQAPPLAARKR